MTNHYALKGTFTERREHALEKIIANYQNRGYNVQRMIQEDGMPLLAVKLPTMIEGKYLKLRRQQDALTSLRVAQGYSTAYGLNLCFNGPS